MTACASTRQTIRASGSIACHSLPISPAARTLALYLAAGVVYVVLGVFVPELLFSSAEGILFLLVAVWALPALARRARR